MSLRHLAGLAVLATACSGRLEHDPSAFFGGIAVTDGGIGGAGGVAMRLDGPPPADVAPPSEPDAGMPAAPDAQLPWDMMAAADLAPPPDMMPPPPDAAPSACAPGPDALALLGMRCGGCHNATSAAKGLDLRSPGLGMRLVGVPSTCQARPYLATGPGAPAGHFLDKLDGPVAGCGNQMPAGGPFLTDREKACVREWAAQAIAKFGSGR